jgi:hypothetical protein
MLIKASLIGEIHERFTEKHIMNDEALLALIDVNKILCHLSKFRQKQHERMLRCV